MSKPNFAKLIEKWEREERAPLAVNCIYAVRDGEDCAKELRAELAMLRAKVDALVGELCGPTSDSDAHHRGIRRRCASKFEKLINETLGDKE